MASGQRGDRLHVACHSAGVAYGLLAETPEFNCGMLIILYFCVEISNGHYV